MTNIGKDNWHRFGDLDTQGDEIVFDPDVEEVEEDVNYI